jgi:XTP/dITP diphosphohydrolase
MAHRDDFRQEDRPGGQSPSKRQRERTLVLATGNPAKVRELNELLEGRGWKVRALSEFTDDTDIAETGATLEENAEIKARFAFETTGLPSLADDTGLEVDALSGRPGVHSARYSGPDGGAEQNRRKLLEELGGISDPARRTARFRTVLVYIEAQNRIHRFEGVCKGRIITEERGDGGFGYDPLFVPEGHKETFAEMDSALKNNISHRGRALQEFLQEMAR